MGKKEQRQYTRLSPEIRGASLNAMNNWTGAVSDARATPLPSTYTGISDERNQALEMMQAPGQQYQPAYGMWKSFVEGDELDFDQNPHFQRYMSDSVGRAMNPVQSQFAAYGMGAGRSSMGGQMAADIGASTAARLYTGSYEGAQGRRMQALQMTPMMEEMQYGDARRMGQVGMDYEADARAQQAEDVRQYTWPLTLAQMETQGLAANPLTAESDTKQVTPFDWLTFAGSLAGGLLNPMGSMFGGSASPPPRGTA